MTLHEHYHDALPKPIIFDINQVSVRRRYAVR